MGVMLNVDLCPSHNELPLMDTSTIKPKVTRYRVNAAFTQAVLFFADGSYLQFEHASRKERWAKASSDDGTAEDVCQALRSFRLNSKHLQLHFEDGSDIDFSHITEQEEE